MNPQMPNEEWWQIIARAHHDDWDWYELTERLEVPEAQPDLEKSEHPIESKHSNEIAKVHDR